jgi:hypothetical protein
VNGHWHGAELPPRRCDETLRSVVLECLAIERRKAALVVTAAADLQDRFGYQK